MDSNDIQEVKRAAIDIGTNTVLLLIGTVKGHRVTTIREEQRVPRLGKGVSANGTLSDDSMERVVRVLMEYREILASEYPDIKQDGVAVIATSAVRDAENRTKFIKLIRQRTHFRVRILTGSEEAEWTYAGAMSVLDTISAKDSVTVLDIGGGSTEVAVGNGYELKDCHSFQMGSVRYTEQFLNGDPPGQDAIRSCETAVEEMFGSRKINLSGNSKTIGVAGTVTSLAYMEIDPGRYDPILLNGYSLNLNLVNKWLNILSVMTTGEMIDKWPDIMIGRADIFIAGLLILKGFLIVNGLSDIIVSTGGIRYGAVLNIRES